MLTDATAENQNETTEEKTLGGRIKNWAKEHDEFLLGAVLGGSTVGAIASALYFHNHPEEIRRYGGYKGRKKPEKKEDSDNCPKEDSDTGNVDAHVSHDMALNTPDTPGNDILGNFNLPTAQGTLATGLNSNGGFNEPIDDGSTLNSILELLDAINL